MRTYYFRFCKGHFRDCSSVRKVVQAVSESGHRSILDTLNRKRYTNYLHTKSVSATVPHNHMLFMPTSS